MWKGDSQPSSTTLRSAFSLAPQNKLLHWSFFCGGGLCPLNCEPEWNLPPLSCFWSGVLVIAMRKRITRLSFHCGLQSRFLQSLSICHYHLATLAFYNPCLYHLATIVFYNPCLYHSATIAFYSPCLYHLVTIACLSDSLSLWQIPKITISGKKVRFGSQYQKLKSMWGLASRFWIRSETEYHGKGRGEMAMLISWHPGHQRGRQAGARTK